MNAAGAPAFLRVAETGRQAVAIQVDGAEVAALAGDTVLTALRSAGIALRHNEFDGGARGGFCLMGACQDCWLAVEGKGSVRACQTPVAAGMRISTRG